MASRYLSEDQYKEKLGAMDDQQVIEQANLLSRGVPMGTPVLMVREKLMWLAC